MKRNLVLGICLVFMSFMLLSSLWIVAPGSLSWKSSFPCCFALEAGLYNIIFALLAERTRMPRVAKEVASWLAFGTVLLPLGLFLYHFLRWRPGFYIVPGGIWAGLVSAMFFLVWLPEPIE
ncbi:MAG: hypothetical protein ABIM46_06145 [candidate division WOR-3 bacterium]